MKNVWLNRKQKKNKCSYRPLSNWEIILIDPHRVKGKGGGRRDLSVCTGSNCPDRGEVVEHLHVRPDPDSGERVGPTHYEPIGQNVEDPNVQENLDEIKGKPIQTKVMITFYVTGFEGDPSKLIKNLGIKAVSSRWRKGDPRRKGLTIKHKDNGFSFNADPSEPFEDAVLGVLKKIHPHAEGLKKAGGKGLETELSVGAYIVGGDVPDFHLPQAAVAMLNDLDAEVDFDLYVLSDTE